VDCPSREKGQYLCDNTVITHSQIYLTGDLNLYKKALMDFALSTYICPGMMGVAPGSYMQEVGEAPLQWVMQLLLYYKNSGDLVFLKEMYPVAERLMNYFERYKREDGLIENVKDKWNMTDWPDNLRDGYDFEISHPIAGDGCHNVINTFYYGALEALYEIMDFLGIKHENGLPILKNAFIKAFYDINTGLFVDSTVSLHSALHSNILPLLYGIAPFESRKTLVEFIRKKRISCGVYMAYFLLKALAASGEYDLLYELLISTDERSWGNMVREGATTCFEAWGKDQKWNTSLCHAWASAPVPVIIEDIAGIMPYMPGWTEISFKPHIPASVEYLTVEFNVAVGHIRMEHKNGVSVLEVPEGVKVHRL
jgi:alpha-L-rhamnosidase